MRKKICMISLLLMAILISGCANQSKTGDVKIIKATEQLQQSNEKSYQNESLKIADEYENFYEQAKQSGTLGSLETQKKIIESIGTMGYTVVDAENQIDMLQTDKIKHFIGLVNQKKAGKTTLICVGTAGDFERYDFETANGKVDVSESHVGWKGTSPENDNIQKYEAYTWEYTKDGYLFFEQYHMSGYDGDSGHRAVRVKPLDEKCRKLNREYILPVGYKLNNMFIMDWNETDFGNIDFYDLFDLFYPKVFGSSVPYTSSDNLGKGAAYHIPREEFEKVIMSHLKIDSTTLQKKTKYLSNKQSYEYRPRGLFDCEPPSYPFPEVESYTDNQDGTITLTVQAVYPDHNTSKAFAYEVTIRPGKDDTYQYVSNHIIQNASNDLGSWRVNRLTDNEWEKEYGEEELR